MEINKCFWTSETQLAYEREKIIKCDGQYLYSENGKKYLDLNSGTWNVLLGYNRKEFNKKINELNNGVQFIPNVRFTHEQGEQLAKRILDKIPRVYSSVFFTSGGSEAVETAIKFAKQYWYNKGFPGKNRIISFYEAYHGSTIAAVSLSSDPWDRIAYDGMLLNTLKAYPYYCYKCRLATNNSCNLACLQDLEKQIQFYGAENISSLIIEPIMGVGGILIPSKEWLQRLVDICHQNNILVIFDEVTSGFGRSGNYFSFMDYGVQPDIIAFGKCISNGVVPLGGTIVTKKIYMEFESYDSNKQFKHGFTNSGHPLSCAIGNIVLDIFEQEKIIDLIKDKEKNFKKIIYKSLKGKKYIGEIRIKGLMIAIELIYPDSNESLVIPDLLYKFKEQGIIMSQMTQVVNFMPSICVKEEEIKLGLDCLIKIVEEYLIKQKIDF